MFLKVAMVLNEYLPEGSLVDMTRDLRRGSEMRELC